MPRTAEGGNPPAEQWAAPRDVFAPPGKAGGKSPTAEMPLLAPLVRALPAGDVRR
jgi:hypothetical protein